MWYPSVEHAYQAAKFLDPELRKPFENEYLKPGDAKKKARILKRFIRPDWEDVNLGIMEDLVRQKFQAPDLRLQLLNTGDEELVEGNYWHDNFWGECTCDRCVDKPKTNHLGRILMKIRKELRDAG